MKHLSLIIAGILIVVAAFLGWQLRGCSVPDAAPAQKYTDSLFVERKPAESDTSGGTKPDRRIIYRTSYDTVNVCLPVPAPDASDFRLRGLISELPVRIEGAGFFGAPRATLTYWQPDALRFEQAVYSIPEPAWSWWIGGGLTYKLTSHSFAADVRANVRWRRLVVWGGYRATEVGYGPAVGVRWRLLGSYGTGGGW